MTNGTKLHTGRIVGSVVGHIVRTHASNGRVHLPNTKMGKAFAKALRAHGVRV